MAPSVQLDPSAFAKHSTRESVSYDDEDRPTATLSSDAAAPPIVRGRFYNNQFSVNQTHAYTSSSRYCVCFVRLPDIVSISLIFLLFIYLFQKLPLELNELNINKLFCMLRTEK